MVGLFILRDKVEEHEWAQARLEQKISDMRDETAALKEELEREREESKKKAKEGENQQGRRRRRSGEEEERCGAGGEGRKQRIVIITDSNGRGATADSIKNHIPRPERDSYDITVEVAYTTEEATRRIDSGNISVCGAAVVIDNLTNDIRGTRIRPAASPQQLVRNVDRLRSRLTAAGATASVVCQAKPMEIADVRQHNRQVSEYLRNQVGGYGCLTQIRLEHLKTDGFHIRPQFDSIVDKTYACAIRGVPVPSPTPPNEFVPVFMRRRWEAEWPRIGGGITQSRNHGW